MMITVNGHISYFYGGIILWRKNGSLISSKFQHWIYTFKLQYPDYMRKDGPGTRDRFLFADTRENFSHDPALIP